MNEEDEGIKPSVSKSDDEHECASTDDEGNGRKRKAKSLNSNSKKNKVRVMNESGQTDSERRHLRQEQRDLQKRIAEMGDEIKNINSDAFEALREENNTLWRNVHFVREAVLDGENMENIGARVIHQVDALIQVNICIRRTLHLSLRHICSFIFRCRG